MKSEYLIVRSDSMRLDPPVPSTSSTMSSPRPEKLSGLGARQPPWEFSEICSSPETQFHKNMLPSSIWLMMVSCNLVNTDGRADLKRAHQDSPHFPLHFYFSQYFSGHCFYWPTVSSKCFNAPGTSNPQAATQMRTGVDKSYRYCALTSDEEFDLKWIRDIYQSSCRCITSWATRIAKELYK